MRCSRVRVTVFAARPAVSPVMNPTNGKGPDIGHDRAMAAKAQQHVLLGIRMEVTRTRAYDDDDMYCVIGSYIGRVL